MAKKQKKIYFSIDEFPREILAGIGEIVVIWGMLEYHLGSLVRRAYRLPPITGRALLIGMDIKVLCGTLRTLTITNHWIKDKELRDAIRDLAIDVENKAGYRHGYAHGVFGTEMSDHSAVSRYLIKHPAHRIKPSSEKITAESLRRISDESHDLLARAHDLAVKFRASKRKSV